MMALGKKTFLSKEPLTTFPYHFSPQTPGATNMFGLGLMLVTN
jgi:hypothetical protein